MGDAVDEFCYHLLAVDVGTIASQLLGDDLQLHDALCHQGLYLCHDVLDGTALLLARNDRNSAIGTLAVAPLADFQVGIVRGSRQPSVVAGFFVIGSCQVGNDLFPVELPIEAVHLGQFLRQFLEIALREATHHDELAKLSLLLAPGQFQNHVDAFLLCVADEAAGIHDSYLTLGVFGIMRHHEAVQLQLTDELLAVNKVLAATEGDNVYRITLIQNSKIISLKLRAVANS